MCAINRLFLFVFLTASVAGCAIFTGSPESAAPVATAVVSSRASARAQAHGSDSAAEAPTTSDARDSGRAAPEISALHSASPDALFSALAALGIDYHYGGHSPATGFDCSGLVAHVFHNAYGINIPAQTGAQSRLGKPIDLRQIETGDLVFYNTQGQPNTHVGIYIGDNRFINAPRTGAAVRIENMRSTYWKTRFNGARRVVF